MNSKNGLFLVAHEMQALAALSRICYTFAVAERHLSVESAHAKLREPRPELSQHERYPDLFRFVVDLGASSGPFLQALREFHEKWVDPKVRRVRLSVFGLLCQIPLSNPLLKIAGLKWVYSCPAKSVRHTFCDALTVRDIRATFAVAEHTDVVDLGETVLRYFHVACRDVLAKDTGTDRIRFLGNLDRDVFGAVLGNTCGGGASTAAVSGEEAVAEVATKYRERLQQTPRVRATRAGLPRATWQAPFSHAASSAAPQALRPRVIAF
ncbi:MAG: hypothetical protein GY772_20975 [bacterium]|nr:hypothetical protein [bacterium]